jgi:pyruvate/2-oxoglutarate dehydrogenase complex dihydrolipoamide dehydrogenase (E3) component
MAQEDPDVAQEIARILSGEGVQVLIGAAPTEVAGLSGNGLTVTVRTPSGEKTIEGSDLLVAVGRIPNTAGIGLEKAGVALDDRSYIRVNERLQTNAPDVWAIGVTRAPSC